MAEKNAEVEELQARLSHLAAQAPNIQIDTEYSRVALLTQVKPYNYIYMQNCTQFVHVYKWYKGPHYPIQTELNSTTHVQKTFSSDRPCFPIDTVVMFQTAG